MPPLCMNSTKLLQHLFLLQPFSQAYWKYLLHPLPVHLNFSLPLPEFFTQWNINYPYFFKKKTIIKRFWNTLPATLCWKIWLARNMSIFESRKPKQGRIMAKASGLTIEAILPKGNNKLDQKILHKIKL